MRLIPTIMYESTTKFRSKRLFDCRVINLQISMTRYFGSLYSRGVVRICCEEGQSWKLGHGALKADFRAGCSSCSMTRLIVLWLMQYWSSCWHLQQLISQITQYLDSYVRFTSK